MTSPKINFIFIPYHNSGGHFFIWSLYFLSGQKTYPCNGQKITVEPTVDQHNKINFHQFPANFAFGFEQCCQLSAQMQLYTEFDCINLYVLPQSLSIVLSDKFSVTINNSTLQQQLQAFDIIKNDTTQMLHWIQQHDHKLIMLDYCESDLLNIVYKNRFAKDHKQQVHCDQLGVWQEYERDFYEGTNNKFDSAIWDVREKMALISSLPKFESWYGCINKNLPHLYYTTDDVWNEFPTVINEIFAYLSLNIIDDRLLKWKAIYEKWRGNHNPAFSRHFDRIIKAILNNEYVDLTRFELDFYKEVLIQHALIHQHNLNIKNWNLTEFPKNTQDIHALLEPNIHKL